MTEGVVGATVGQFKAHPLIWGGLLAAVLVVGYVATRGSGGSAASPANTSFGFNLGPSDTAIASGAAIQIAQIQASQAGSIAANKAATDQVVAQDYIGYLGTASANSLSGLINSNAATVAQTQIASNTSIANTPVVVGGQVKIAAGHDAAATAEAASAAAAQVGVAQANAQATLGVAQANDAASVASASIAAGVVNNQTAAALAAVQNTNATTLQVNVNNNQTSSYVAGLNASVQQSAITAGQQVADLQTQTAGAVAMQGYQNQLQIATMQNQTNNTAINDQYMLGSFQTAVSGQIMPGIIDAQTAAGVSIAQANDLAATQIASINAGAAKSVASSQGTASNINAGINAASNIIAPFSSGGGGGLLGGLLSLL